ncbi:GAG-pre-integrase domain-containing protein, partial [Serratia marcescens]|uniref:GAG-pre-integrase domain-containing protein n=1 Tax=Serratia marcescens TaxID=615 RepID=UPI0028143B43
DLVVAFHKDICYVKNEQGVTLLTGTRLGNVYKLNWKNKSSGSLCLVTQTEQSWLWHKRLNHLNFKTINKLSSNDLVVGMPKMVFSKDKMC